MKSLVPYPLQELHAGLRPAGLFAKWLESGHIRSPSANPSVLNNRCRSLALLGRRGRFLIDTQP